MVEDKLQGFFVVGCFRDSAGQRSRPLQSTIFLLVWIHVGFHLFVLSFMLWCLTAAFTCSDFK